MAFGPRVFVLVLAAFLLFGCVDVEDVAPVIGGGLPGGSGDGSGGTGLPGVPSLPGIPEIPGVPGLPDVPGGDGAPDGSGLPPGIDPFAAQSSRSFVEFIVNMENPLISQLVTAQEMAAVLNISDNDPLKQQLDTKTQLYIDEIVDNPRSTIKELLEATQLAQSLGLSHQAAYEKIVEKANERLDAVLADPDAPIPDLLVAAQLLQEIGAENSDEATQQVMNAIQAKISAKLDSEDMCRRQLLDLAEISQLLGFGEISQVALAKAQSAAQFCGSVNFEDKHEEEGNSRRIVADVQGNLKEFALFGFASQEARSYYFGEGTFTWTYRADPEIGACVTTTRSGEGTIQLTDDPTNGQLNVNANGEYSGSIISKNVQLTVSKELAPQDPEADCSYIDTDDLGTETEDYYVSIRIEGTTDNRLLLKNQAAESTEGSGYADTTTTTWDLRLPDTATAIKLT